MIQLKQKILQDLIQSHKNYYEYQCDRWRDLDGKAQGLIAVAGMFIAAGFAFVTDIRLEDIILGRSLTTATLISLIVVVILGLFALRLRKVYLSPLGLNLEKMTHDYLRLEDHEIEAHYDRFLTTQSRRWKQTTTSNHIAIMDKVKYLRFAQYVLVLSILLISTLIVLQTIRFPREASHEVHREEVRF